MEKVYKRSIHIILPNLRASQGFAVLLYSYIVVWFVVMFTTTLLAMSTLDVNHAQRAIATQQAFWAAEGELEGTVADLKVDQTVFALAEDMCLSYGSRTLKSDGSIRSTSSLCGTSTANTYRLDITGTSGSTTQKLATIVEFAGPGTTQFTHVAFADGITADGVETGSVDTTKMSAAALSVLAAHSSSIRNEGGSLATRRAARMLAEVWDKVKGKHVREEKPPIEILGNSQVHGGIFLGPNWDGRLDDGDKEVELAAQSNLKTTDVQPLPEEIPWPAIQVPEGATDLGKFVLANSEDGLKSRECLKSGTYTASWVILKKGTELCTRGTVELYVTGETLEAKVARDDDEPLKTKLRIAKEAKLYGQPADAEPYARHYSPQDLRIFVTGDGLVKIGAKDSMTAALIYAPEAKVKAKAGTFLGAIIAKQVELNEEGGGKGTTLIYDKALKGKNIPVGSSNEVNIKVWTEGPLLEKPTTASTSTTTSTAKK